MDAMEENRVVTERFLRLDLGYVGMADVVELGTILQRIGEAYAEDMELSGSANATLTVESIQFGSIFVVLRECLEIAKTASDVISGLDSLERFVARMRDYIVVLKESTNANVPVAMRLFLDALTRPVASGDATYARVIAQFSNGNVVEIERATAIDIRNALEVAASVVPSPPPIIISPKVVGTRARKTIQSRVLLDRLNVKAKNYASQVGAEDPPPARILRSAKPDANGLHWRLVSELRANRFLRHAEIELMDRYDTRPLAEGS